MVYGFKARRAGDNRRNGWVIIGAIIRKENADRKIYLAEPYC
jgi:hypothetical protein